MFRTISRRITSALAMPVLAAGLIGGGAVALSGAAWAANTEPAAPAVVAVATAQPPTGHRSLGPAPASTTPVEPARYTDRFNGEPVQYLTSL